jgi:hypothetical protein
MFRGAKFIIASIGRTEPQRQLSFKFKMNIDGVTKPNERDHLLKDIEMFVDCYTSVR